MMRVVTDYQSLRVYTAAVLVAGLCYPHKLELGCHVLIPKCDPVSRQVIHPCREMCHDLRACSKMTLPKGIIINEKFPGLFSEDNVFVMGTTYIRFDGNYLPSLREDMPCLYKNVTCKCPPSVQNAAVLNFSDKTFSALDTVDYSCNEGFQIEGTMTAFCTYSGEWSTSPQCLTTSESSIHPLIVVLPVLLFLLSILFATVMVKKRIKLKPQRKPDLKTDQAELDNVLMEFRGTD